MSGILPNQEFSSAVTAERERTVRGHVERRAHLEVARSVDAAAEMARGHRRWMRGHHLWQLGRSVLGRGRGVTRPAASAPTPATVRPGR